MFLKSETFELEEILNQSEIVIFDTNIFNLSKDSILELLYDLNKNLCVDKGLLLTYVNLSSKLFNLMSSRNNLYVVQGTKKEMGNYISKINEVVLFHEKKFKHREKIKNKKKNGYYDDGASVEDFEFENLNLIKNYANNQYNLLKNFNQKNTLSVLNKKTLNNLILKVENLQLKENTSLKYRAYDDKRTETERSSNHTDEEISLISYELASLDKNVSIISNDKDILRILNFLSSYEQIRTPEIGSVLLYYYSDKDEKYKISFDSTLHLYDKR